MKTDALICNLLHFIAAQLVLQNQQAGLYGSDARPLDYFNFLSERVDELNAAERREDSPRQPKHVTHDPD